MATSWGARQPYYPIVSVENPYNFVKLRVIINHHYPQNSPIFANWLSACFGFFRLIEKGR